MAFWNRDEDELPALEELIRQERGDLARERLAQAEHDAKQKIHDIHMKARMDQALAMQAVKAQGFGALVGGGHLGQQTKQSAMAQQMAALAGMAGQAKNAAGVPLRGAGAAGSQERLNDLALSIGVTPDEDGFVTLTMVLEKIAQAANLIKPIAKDVDMISAIEEAHDAN